MANICSKCGHSNRDTAKFCTNCRTPLSPAGRPGAQPPPAAGPPVPGTGQQVKQAVAQVGSVVGPAASRAGAALAPVAKQAATAGWAGSRKGMSLFARLVTGGGRAAYAEAFNPPPLAEGLVAGTPTTSLVPTPVEPAALLFVLAFPLGALLLQLKWPGGMAVFAAAYLLLLALAYAGIRRPYFTRLTFAGLWQRLAQRSQPAQVPLTRFHLQDRVRNQPIDVVLAGNLQGGTVSPGAYVQVWGIHEPGRAELRAWRLQVLNSTGQPQGIISAPRLVSFVVALFIPLTLWLIAWIGLVAAR
jgi:hypothetical protein